MISVANRAERAEARANQTEESPAQPVSRVVSKPVSREQPRKVRLPGFREIQVVRTTEIRANGFEPDCLQLRAKRSSVLAWSCA